MHAHRACRRPRQTGQDADEGGLAGAVGAQQAEELTFLDVEADAVQGLQARLALGALLARGGIGLGYRLKRDGGHGRPRFYGPGDIPAPQRPPRLDSGRCGQQRRHAVERCQFAQPRRQAPSPRNRGPAPRLRAGIRAAPPARKNRTGSVRWRRSRSTSRCAPPAPCCSMRMQAGDLVVRQPGGQDQHHDHRFPIETQLLAEALDLLRAARAAIRPSMPLLLISCVNWLR